MNLPTISYSYSGYLAIAIIAALDSVFVHIVNQEYYMRLFVDCYEEIMPQEIDKCFEELN